MKVLFIFGTRPEAIKMAPVVRALQADPDSFEVRVCVTAQHRQMLDQVLDFFCIRPDYDLNLMRPDQTLFDLTAASLLGLRPVIEDFRPDNIFVQGDTTSAFVGALAGYYLQTRVSHVEAGLRSGNKYAPYPEECNRVLAGHLADYHFAPTPRARENLAREGITNDVWVVGNTVIDALLLGLARLQRDEDAVDRALFTAVDFRRRVVLITGHRRESFGKPFEDMATALRQTAERFDDIELVYPVHLNPNVQAPVKRILGGHPRIHLIEPLDYPSLIWLMNRAHVVVTDSGGIQEEAPSLGKPVLVMREVTERQEGIEAGTARLVGTDRDRIVSELSRLLTDEAAYQAMAQANNPYGDGKTSERIRDLLLGREPAPLPC